MKIVSSHCSECGAPIKRPLRRNLHKSQLRTLYKMQEHEYLTGEEWVHVPSLVPSRARDDAMLCYWGLVERSRDVRPDGGEKGVWRLTEKGFQFLRGELKIEKYAWVKDKRVIYFDGPLITIGDVDPEFDLREI